METKHDKRMRQHLVTLAIMGIIALGLAIIVGASYFLVFNESIAQDQAIWGQFGDFVGGVLNPIFALLALFALFYTIILQVKV